MEKAQKEVDRLAALTNRLLDVARMAAGGFSMEPASMDLVELVQEVAARMQADASAAGAAIRVSGSASVVGAWDRDGLDQVVTNLLSNAIKFGRGQPIDVMVEARRDLAGVRVRDRGIGVAPGDRERIFERFERGVSEQSFGGLGLGLWIARQIVTAHGGRIGVEVSDAPGAEFFFWLPTNREDFLRVLVVDDDAPSVDALRFLLESAGHRVDCAGNGREALSRLREANGYCVILLDIMMPVMNGYEFREEQLKDPKLASIPVIVVTADGRAREKAQQIGSDVFFQKPLAPRELLRAIGRYCPPESAA